VISQTGVEGFVIGRNLHRELARNGKGRATGPQRKHRIFAVQSGRQLNGQRTVNQGGTGLLGLKKKVREKKEPQSSFLGERSNQWSDVLDILPRQQFHWTKGTEVRPCYNLFEAEPECRRKDSPHREPIRHRSKKKLGIQEIKSRNPANRKTSAQGEPSAVKP